MGMLICSECGSPDLDLLKHEVLERDDEGDVTKFREWYECADCGNTGIKTVKDNINMRRPQIKHRGIEWREGI